jgi:transposase
MKSRICPQLLSNQRQSVGERGVSLVVPSRPPKSTRCLYHPVERTFSWLSQNRRMSKDYERLCASAEAFIYVAMSRLMVRRLARA